MRAPFKSPEERAQYKAWQVETADQRRQDAENAVIECQQLEARRDERTAALRALRLAAEAKSASQAKPAATRAKRVAKAR